MNLSSSLTGIYLSVSCQQAWPGWAVAPEPGEHQGRSVCCKPWKWQASGGAGSQLQGDLAVDTGWTESGLLRHRTQSTDTVTDRQRQKRRAQWEVEEAEKTDINRGRRSNIEARGGQGIIIKGGEEGGERMEERAMQRHRTDEENKHPIQHVLALQQAVRRYLLWWKHTGITGFRSSRIRHCAIRGCP